VVVGACLSLPATLPVLAQQPEDASPPVSDEEITVSLSVAGPPGCGSDRDLASRIAWRTSRVRIVPEGASERRLEVTLEVSGNSTTATLLLTLPNGRRATRVLKAARCDEAVDAAALVAAVTLDPTASTVPTPQRGEDAGTPAVDGAAATGGPPPMPPPDAEPPDSRGGTAGTGPQSRTEFSGAAFVPVELVAGPAPSVLYGFGVGLMGVWERDSVISPALRLSFVHFLGQEYEETGGTAYFGLNAFNLDLCPVRLGNVMVGLFTCASGAFGKLHAEGRNTNDAHAEDLDWWMLGGTLLLELRPIGQLEVQLFGTLGRPLLRHSFQFGCPAGAPAGSTTAAPPTNVTDCEPNVFHEVSGLSAQGGFALGLFFR
jgi:hypothetical protein